MHLSSALAPLSLPLIIWHGLGDVSTSPGLSNLAHIYQTLHPTTPVHIITLPSDRASTFHGHLPSQLALVCDQLASLPPAFHASSSGVNLLGLSQGGQFLRGLVQTCESLPPVHTLMTFGSQHTGISKFLPGCAPADWLCLSAERVLSQSRWGAWTQRNVVPAQYFRDTRGGREEWERYLSRSGWLAGINNEREEGREREGRFYADRLARVGVFVMYKFGEDRTVFPPGSAWFWDVEFGEGEEGEEGKVVPLRETRLYKEDWIGLRRLDDRGALRWETFEGMEHMRFSDEMAREAFVKYFPRVESGWEKQVGKQPVEEL